jgi:hypothetical protein
MKLVAAASWTLLLCVLAGVAVFGQASTRAVLSPIPAWPSDGNIPDHLKNNYVFLGPRVGEVTVSYPANLDDPSQTGRKTFTFELHNLVAPSVSVAIAQDPSGAYTYDYSLRNGEWAKQAIRTWSFVGPAGDSSLSANGPDWTATKIPTARARQIALPSVSQLGAEVIFHSGSGNDILPGSALNRFHVTSTYSPGFTTAFVRSGAAFDLPSELPTPVADQIGVLAKPDWDSQPVVILGPRFSPGSSVAAIAADFHIGITRLIRNGTLSGDSPFVKQALATLAKSVESGGIPTPGDVVKSLPKPSPGIESEIATAMQVSPK